MKFTNKFALSQSLVDVITKRSYDITQSDPKRIGVTTLNNPPRIRQLSVRHWNSLEDDVSNYLWMILGDSVHFILAKTKQDKRLIEEKIETKIDDITIVAKPDLYDDEHKIIEDYKITSVWAVKEVKREWEEQINCYAWALHLAGFPVLKAYINAILRDWSEMEYKRFGRDYPPIPFKRIEIPLWGFEKQDQFIKERIRLYKISMLLKDEELPLCTEEERWRVPDKWAIYKEKNKTATKLCSSYNEAVIYISNIKNKQKPYTITKRPGIDNRCVRYCQVNKFCDYWQKVYGDKNEK